MLPLKNLARKGLNHWVQWIQVLKPISQTINELINPNIVKMHVALHQKQWSNQVTILHMPQWPHCKTVIRSLQSKSEQTELWKFNL